jgi:hypothetical protein
VVRGTDKFGARSEYSRRHLKYNDYVDKAKTIEAGDVSSIRRVSWRPGRYRIENPSQT